MTTTPEERADKVCDDMVQFIGSDMVEWSKIEHIIAQAIREAERDARRSILASLVRKIPKDSYLCLPTGFGSSYAVDTKKWVSRQGKKLRSRITAEEKI